MTKIELVNVLQYLKRNRSIQKKTNEMGPLYSLSIRGETKLAFYEYSYQCYQQWKPKCCIGEDNGWHAVYCNEMATLIKELNYFGYENVANVG